MQNSYRTHSHYYQMIKQPAWWRSVLLCKKVAGRRPWVQIQSWAFLCGINCQLTVVVNPSYCVWYVHCCVPWLASATVTQQHNTF